MRIWIQAESGNFWANLWCQKCAYANLLVISYCCCPCRCCCHCYCHSCCHCRYGCRCGDSLAPLDGGNAPSHPEWPKGRSLPSADSCGPSDPRPSSLWPVVGGRGISFRTNMPPIWSIDSQHSLNWLNQRNGSHPNWPARRATNKKISSYWDRLCLNWVLEYKICPFRDFSAYIIW